MKAKEYTEDMGVEYLITNKSGYMLMEAYALYRIGLYLKEQSKTIKQ